MSYKKFQLIFFVSILTISVLLTLIVFRSYLTLLAFGAVLAVLARPVYRYVLGKVRSETAAALLTVVAISLTILLPAAFFFAALSAELISVFSSARTYFDTTTLTQFFQRILPAGLQSQIPAIMQESVGILRSIVELISTNLLLFFSNIFAIVFGFFVVLIVLYYLLKDGGKIKREMLALSPLGDEHDELVFHRVIVAVQAVMGGVLIMGLVKGALAGFFFWIFGIPAPLFWGTMTGFASFLPVFGSSLVTVPAIIYLLINGRIVAAIGLLVVSIALIGAIDNFLQPKLVESKTKIHPLLILLSILGGLEFYGFPGFILGPLTLAVTMALIDIYKRQFRNFVEDMA